MEVFAIAMVSVVVLITLVVSAIAGQREQGPALVGASVPLVSSTIDLRYCPFRGRLTHIGDTQIRYGLLGGPPKRLGGVKLRYGVLSRRLRRIGNVVVHYSMFGRYPKRLGQMSIEYDGRAYRIRRVGALAIQYDRWGRRPKHIGHMRIHYDQSLNRPVQVTTEGRQANLGSHELLVLFFVLYMRGQANVPS